MKKQYLYLILPLFTVDRFLKWWAFTRLSEEVFYFGPLLRFHLFINKGLSWSIGTSYAELSPLAMKFFVALALAFFCMYTLFSYRKGTAVWGEVLVCAGGISNYLDRVIYGGVIDFIHIDLGRWSIPTVFNIADIFISIGMLMILARITHTKKV